MPNKLNKRDFFILSGILLLGFIYMYFYNSHKIAAVVAVAGDSHAYSSLAVNILKGNGFSLEEFPPFTPSCFRTPAYPLFLALTYKMFGVNNYEAVRLAQVFLMLASAAMIFIIAHLVFQNKMLAYLSLIISSFYPYPYSTIPIYTSIGTETLTFFLITAATLCIILLYKYSRAYLYFCAGLFFALAMLTRPSNLFFPLVIAAYMVFRRPHKANYRRILWFLVVIFLFVSPWSVRNYLRCKKAVILSVPLSGLFTFGGSITHNPEFLPYYDSDFGTCGVYIEPQDLALAKKHLRGLAESLGGDTETIYAHDNELRKIGFKIIKRDYLCFLKGWGYRILGHWHFGDLANIINGITKKVTLGAIARIIIKAGVAVIVMVGFFSNLKNVLCPLLFLFPVYNTLIYTVLIPCLKYGYPSYGLIFILFSAGICRLYDAARSSIR